MGIIRKSIINEVRELIRFNKTKDAIELLLKDKDFDEDVQNRIILLSSRYYNWKRGSDIGKNNDIELNTINYSLLELVSEISGQNRVSDDIIRIFISSSNFEYLTERKEIAKIIPEYLPAVCEYAEFLTGKSNSVNDKIKNHIEASNVIIVIIGLEGSNKQYWTSTNLKKVIFNKDKELLIYSPKNIYEKAKKLILMDELKSTPTELIIYEDLMDLLFKVLRDITKFSMIFKSKVERKLAQGGN